MRGGPGETQETGRRKVFLNPLEEAKLHGGTLGSSGSSHRGGGVKQAAWRGGGYWQGDSEAGNRGNPISDWARKGQNTGARRKALRSQGWQTMQAQGFSDEWNS